MRDKKPPRHYQEWTQKLSEIANAIRANTAKEDPVAQEELDESKEGNRIQGLGLGEARKNTAIQRATMVLTALAFGAAVGAYLQTKRQADIAQEQLVASTRAWVTVTTGRIDKTDPIVYVKALNSGTTPAFELHWIEADDSTQPPCTKHTHRTLTQAEEQSNTHAVIGAGDDLEMAHNVTTIDAASFNDMRVSPRRTHYFWGGFAYQDIFKKEHAYRYCIAVGENVPKHPETGDRIGYCPCHNEAD